MIRKLATALTLVCMFLAPAQAYDEPFKVSLSPEVFDGNLPMHDSSRIFFNRVTKRMIMPDYARIVLVGFDTGRTSQFLVDKIEDAKIMNYVLSPELVEFAELQHAHPRIENRYGNIFRADRKLKNKADMVFCSWAVGYIPDTKQVISLKTMRSMLKEGGTCAVIYPMKGSPLSSAIESIVQQAKWSEKLVEHVEPRSSYRPDQYANFMTRAGFKDVTAEKHVYSLYFNDRSELEAFVRSGLGRYLPHLNEADQEQLITDVTDQYMDSVSVKDGGQIPYQVDMVLAVARNTDPQGF